MLMSGTGLQKRKVWY